MHILKSLLAAFLMTAAAFAGSADPRQAFGQLPAWFEPSPTGSSFLSRGANLSLSVDPSGATVSAGGATTRLTFAGSTKASALNGIDRQDAVTNYLVSSKGSWRTGVPHFQRVAAREVYPGVDVVYYSAGKNLEYDFVLQPGADPAGIRVQFSGARPALQSDGTLMLAGGIRQLAPVAWQVRDTQRIPVDSRYLMTRSGEVRFQLGEYDKSLPLVIDPVISWAGYMGGGQQETVNATVADPSGGFWLAGASSSYIAIPENTSPYLSEAKSTKDAFIARIVPDGSAWKLAYFSYIGGSGDEEATGIAMLGARIAITGNTTSTDFPQSGNTFQNEIRGGTDAFVFLYDPAASGLDCLTFSSYYGGPGTENAQAIAAGPGNTLAVAGYTDSGELNGISDWSLQAANRGGVEAFMVVAKPFESAPVSLQYATFFGGSSTDLATAVAIDSAGMIYFAGTSMSPDLPVSDNARYPYPLSFGDAYIVKINPNMAHFDSFLYGSYFGGSGLDSAQAMSLDAQNRVWVTGYTNSDDLPISPGTYQLSRSGGFDSFLMRLDLSKTGAGFVDYCSYLGGSGSDIAYAIAVQPGTNEVTIAGYTSSSDFIFKNISGYEPPTVRQVEMFASRIDPSRTGSDQLVWSLLFGGSGADTITGVALDQAGNAFIAGFTGSQYLNVNVDGGKPNRQGVNSGFFLKLDQ